MQLDLIILTKTKETFRYCKSFDYGGESTLNTVANDLMHVSVLVEDHTCPKGSSIFMPTHAPSRLALACPIMPIMDQYLRTHFKSYKLSTNN
jgi:hypothetical protein